MPSSEGLRLELCQIEFFDSKKLFVLKNFGSKIFFGPKIFWVEFSFDQKIFLD